MCPRPNLTRAHLDKQSPKKQSAAIDALADEFQVSFRDFYSQLKVEKNVHHRFVFISGCHLPVRLRSGRLRRGPGERAEPPLLLGLRAQRRAP
jgi:hypothetical protein